MRVATYYNNNDVRIEERSIPKIGEGELLVKIRAAGICGSDVMEWYRVGSGPRVLGHEIAGEIKEIGPGVTGFKEGDRIAASHHVPCYSCHYCQLGSHTLCDTLRKTHFDPGGFAEWVRLPKINVRYGVYPLPQSVSDEEATFIEPLACVLRGQRKVGVRAPQTVLIIGAGATGLLHLLLARASGVQRVVLTDLVDYRLKVARNLGAAETLRASENIPQEIQKMNEGRLADVVIVCVGAKSAQIQALQSVGRGGTVLFFAPVSPDMNLEIPANEIFWEKGVSLMSSYAASPEDHRDSLEWIRSGKINVRPLITHRLALAEVAQGFQLAAKAQESIKVIIDPTR